VADILAIVSKAVFERDARVGGEALALGQVWSVDRYASSHKALEPLRDGGRVFLVTVRPPDEKLWLVGVIESPKHDGSAWVAPSANRVAAVDISALRKTIVFESGKGMSQEKGALGMSLQTPRALAADDVTQLLAAAGVSAAPPVTPAASGDAAALLVQIAQNPRDDALRERALRELLERGAIADVRQAMKGVAHFDAHDERGLPCLCKNCWETSQDTCEHGGLTFRRDLVVKNARVLFFWAPAELSRHQTTLRNSVRASLSRRLEELTRSRKKQLRPEF
jgi:hypothetical protein